MNLKYILNSFFSILYYEEEKCIVCDKYIEECFLCEQCIRKMLFANYSRIISVNDMNIKCYSSLYYGTVVQMLIKGLKYKKDFRCGKILSDYMFETITTKNIKFDLITFVPMHKRDKRRRGYNQSEYISRKIYNKFDNKEIKYIKVIKKNKITRDQIGLNENERWENLKGCFKLACKDYEIKDKKILLIDDVLTSGATAYFCCSEMLKYGAKEIVVLTAATKRM